MEDIVNQTPTDIRSQLTERMQSQYPDRNFGTGDSPDGTDSLEQAIWDYIQESDTRSTELTGKLDKLKDLFNTSPRASVFLNTLASTQNPAQAIYEAYGKEAHDAFVSGDATDTIAAIEAEDAKAKAEEDQFLEEKKANLNKSIEDLQAFGEEKGLSTDQQVDLFVRVHKMLQDAFDGIYPREIFEAMLRADNYENDVNSARQEGEVNGRNAKINEMTRRRSQVNSMPPNLAGQGVRSMESPKPAERQTEGDFWTD